MAGMFVPDEQVAYARQLARETFEPVLDLIRRNTTVSSERTVLRFLGIAGAGAGGVPLANLMVDRLKDAGVLNRGVAYWYGRALKMGAQSPLEAVERIVALPLDKFAPLPPQEEASIKAFVKKEIQASVDELRRRVAERDALKNELKMGEAPHKYVIVATGNIYDDVDQARAAAQAGADVIAVIRSTAQSLLDYVPHGALVDGGKPLRSHLHARLALVS